MLKRERIDPVLFLIIIMAVVLGTGTFAAIYYVTTRPERPEGTQEVVVDGITFVVRIPPERRVRLVDAPQPVVTEPNQGGEVVPPAPESGQGEQAPPAPTAVTVDTPVPPTPLPPPDQIIRVPYVVQQTDTLFSIANNRGDTSIALMARYGIDATDLIPGAEIPLPIVNPNFCPDAGLRPYLVHEGDTAYSLGRRFNTTADNLRAINNLNENYTIRIADVICVPNQ